MASLGRRPSSQRLPALLAIAVLSCLQLALHVPVHAAASSQLSSSTPRPLARAATATGTPPQLGADEAGGEVEVGGGVSRRGCTYTVQIKTSCSSPRSSPDAVSLAFGDVYGNEVYAPRVTPPAAYGGFERCAKDTFKVSGPCGYGVCYLYLRRTGSVGWTPEWVRVYEPSSTAPSTFYFGNPLANGKWYGLDRCLRLAGAAGVDDAGDGAYPGAAAAVQAQ